MIECVTLENSHNFSGNPLYSQHRLRYQSIIERQKWDVPFIRSMEYDSYDNPAAHYLIKRDDRGQAVGVSRLYPTDRPYMLEEHFSHLISLKAIPKNERIWETTRFCVDCDLPAAERKSIMQELVVAHLEFALERNIKSIVALTYPVFWKNIFISAGWNVEWLGEVHKSEEGRKIVAGQLHISPAVLSHVRQITGIQERVLNYGNAQLEERIAA